MRAAVFAGEGKLEVRDVAVPEIETPDDVLIQVAANGICGSDLRALTVPPQMVYEPNVIIGHEFVGRVAAVGSDVGATVVGQRVTAVPNVNCQTCWYCRSAQINLCENIVHLGSMRNGGAAGYVLVPERLVVPVPDSVSDELATLAEPLACVLNGTRAAAVHPGETVVVLGAGPIGLLYLLMFKAAGARVIVSEVAERRAALAEQLGADSVVDPRSQDVAEAARAATAGRGADVVVESVGALLEDAVGCARKGARVMVFGVNERARSSLSISEVVYRELHIHGVYIGKGTFPLAVELLARDQTGFDRMVTDTFDLGDTESAVRAAQAGEVIKPVLLPSP